MIGAVALELNLFTSQQSPMQLHLLQLLAAARSYARSCNAELPSSVSFLGASLLLYLEPSEAFVCLVTMLTRHHMGWMCAVTPPLLPHRRTLVAC